MTISAHHTTQVLVVGAGPVGLTLALDLAQRGVQCLLIDQKPVAQRLPKMERCNARSMEIYRRLGLADRIRAASFPAEGRMDIGIMKTMAEEPLVRLTYPSVAESRAAIAACDDGSMPLEPYQIVSQYTLEPLLRREVEAWPNATVRFGTDLVSFEQDPAGVTAVITGSGGTQETIRAQYMVGCDGGRSTVRKGLGIALEGQGGIARRNQVFIRCDDFFRQVPSQQGRMYFLANGDESIITVQDDLKHFSFHTNCWGTHDELQALMRQAIGLPLDIEILAATPWTLHLLVAEKLHDRRIFIAGDAKQLVIPTGGLGLNTGIGDAIDLAWKLAGALAGWGGERLLASYGTERLEVGRRNRDASGYAAMGQVTWRKVVRPYMYDDTPEGRGTLAAVKRTAANEQRKTHEMIGTEYGYRYTTSDVICHEEGEWCPDVRECYIPTSRPGARLPHMWLRDGTALQDRLGAGYTVLRLRSRAADATGLVEAMRATGAPVTLLDLDEPRLREIYGADLLLLRPDVHVAWRGDHAPAEPARVAATVTGH